MRLRSKIENFLTGCIFCMRKKQPSTSERALTWLPVSVTGFGEIFVKVGNFPGVFWQFLENLSSIVIVTLFPVSVTGFGEILKGLVAMFRKLIKFNCKMFKLVLNFVFVG